MLAMAGLNTRGGAEMAAWAANDSVKTATIAGRPTPQSVIDEVIWVVGDEPILKSEVEITRLQSEAEGIKWDGDPDCQIPEQIAVQKLFLHQAALDSIEVTESVLVKNRHLLIDKLQQFHQSGYQVWLDDFGSAYSSLNVLQNYEFDELKIDQGLLRYFNEDSRKIIRSIVLMAKEMGIHVLAEGAETKKHVDFLRSIGCEKIQGYYYGRPMPYELLREHCKKKGWLLETLSEEQACDAAGLVNLITDAPVAIFQYREDDAQIGEGGHHAGLGDGKAADDA